MTIYIINKFQEGFKAFCKGKTIADCPYSATSEDGEKWYRGYMYASGEEYDREEHLILNRYQFEKD
jgi:ribosome modulation factor